MDAFSFSVLKPIYEIKSRFWVFDLVAGFFLDMLKIASRKSFLILWVS